MRFRPRLCCVLLVSVAGMAAVAGTAAAFATKVALPNGHRLFLECRGKGRPTVVLEAG